MPDVASHGSGSDAGELNDAEGRVEFSLSKCPIQLELQRIEQWFGPIELKRGLAFSQAIISINWSVKLLLRGADAVSLK